MINLLERWVGQRPTDLPESLVSINLLAMDTASKSLLKAQVRRNSRTVNVLVHPYFREDETNGKYPFPLTPEYTAARDSFIVNTVEEGKPLMIFEEAAKCATLAEQIAAKRGIVYWVATCDGDATPALIKEDPQFGLFMHYRTRMRLEAEAWDKVKVALSSVGIRRLNVGGRYMVLHEPTTDPGQRFLDDLRKSAKGKKNTKEIIDRGLIPGACPGQLMIKMLHRGFDISLSEISSPTNTLTPTDLTNHPDLLKFY